MSYIIGDSKIHGKGIIAVKDFEPGEKIDKGIVFHWYLDLIPIPYVTNHFGKWINHSYNPSACLRWDGVDWFVVAAKRINKKEEITVNYSHTPWYIEGPRSYYT